MVALTYRCLAGALCVCLMLSHFVSTAPPPPSYEGLRDLYQQLLEAGEGYEQGSGPAPGSSGAVGTAGLLGLLAAGPGGVPAPLNSHQMVRKSNRTPSLRLRYGRRSDPSMKSSCFEQSAVEPGES